MKSSFKIKLILSYFAVALLSFSFISIALNKKLEEFYLNETKNSLTAQALLVENQLNPDILKKENAAALSSLIKSLGQKISCRITVITKEGRVIADSQGDIALMENHLNRPEIKAALGGETGENIRYSPTLKIEMFYIALPLKDKEDTAGVLRLALPLSSIKTAFTAVRKIVLISLLSALGLAFIFSSVFAARLIKPLNRIVQAAKKFSSGDFSRRIHPDTADELGELASTLNKMAQNLEDKIGEIEVKNQQLMAILESMVDGIVVVDGSSRIISLNRTVEKIFNISKTDSEGKIFLEVIRNNDMAEIIGSVLEKKEFVSRELTVAWPVQKIFQIDASPIFEKNRITGCLLVIHDITRIRKLETMRRDFVANVSHELKTPLTSIKGFVETLLEGALEDKENSRHFLQIIHGHANRLDSLVNDLLDLSHLESKEITLEKKETNIKNLADDILAGFKSQLKKKSVTVKNDLAADLAARVDEGKIGQVLTNLIDNAIKFNRENGTIRIYNRDSGGKTTIFVEDSGIGIPPKDIPRIFERFYRVDKARSRELGGTGLGLSIVRHIVELHGGSVGIESTEGMGSKFYFCLLK